jgi:hypothetical protein
MRTLLATFLALSWLLGGCGKPHAKFKVPPPTYPVLTFEILKGIPDDKLEGAVLDHVGSKIGEDYEHEHAIVTSMSKGFQMVYATVELEDEVANGGFNQYFFNSTGEFRNEALEGYKLLGAAEHEKITAEAIRVYNEIKPKLEEAKAKGTIEAFSQSYKDNPLNKLDDRFYDLKEDTSAMRVKFIREHPELFVSP